MSYYIEKLEQISKDKYQKEAYDTEDSTVVIAGPGSGKTTVLTLKIIKLLNEYISEPQGLACLTYSREAAREFEERLKKLGYVKRKNVFLGTVHAFCISEIIGNFGSLYNYGFSFPIKIVSKTQKKEIFEMVKKDLGFPKITMTNMDKERTLRISGSSKVDISTDDNVWKVAKEYDKRLLSAGLVDYESIIILSTKMIQEQEYIRKCLTAKFPWIVVDEYQDLGRPLHEMILSLFTKTNIKIFVVGDKDQSIYGFQGAIPDYLEELYTRKDIIHIELMNNYRSNQDIVDGSEIVLNETRNYIAVTREDEHAEYQFITCTNGLEDQYEYFVENIFPHYRKAKIPYEEISVLLSCNQDCKDLAIYCMKAGIPYYISKHDFERTDFIKWLESCALWINDKTSASFDEIYEYWENVLLMHRKDKFFSKDDKLREKKDLYEVLINSSVKKDNLKDWIVYMRSALKLESFLKDSEQLPDELDNIQSLYDEVCDERYKYYDTTKFSRIGKPENQIIISTRHSSKGLEFEIVVLMGMEEEHFPSWRIRYDSMAIYEENRMCFVCVSRAKKTCILMRSTDYDEYNKKYKRTIHRKYKASRYWNQLYTKYGMSD